MLKDLPDFINDIKHHYHSYNMVDESINEASESAAPDVSVQGKRIYKVITSSEADSMLEDYYLRCPNKFLKILAGFSYLIKEYGDKKVNGVSLYIKNLNYLIEEINLEIVKSMQLSYWLKGLPVIALVPLAFPPFLETWMSGSFPAAKAFFASSVAFILKNIIIFITVLCYFLILQIQKNENKTQRYKPKDKILDYKILDIRWIRNIVDIFKPKSRSLNYKQLAQILQDAGSPLNIECIQLRKIFFGVASFIMLMGIFVTSHVINKNAILNDSMYGIQKANAAKMLGDARGKEDLRETMINNTDKIIMAKVKKIGWFNEAQYKAAIVSIIESMGYDKEETSLVADRVYNKIFALQKEHVMWWEILIAVILAYIIARVPIWLLLFQKSLKKVDMQDEVFQFHTIIILLMHHGNVDVQVILEWMKQFSDVFRNPIIKCLNNFHNPYQALQQLKADAKFKEFENIVDNLQMATDKINIISAFDSLELERDFYKDSRKEQNKHIVEKKIGMGKLIGFIPFYAVIALYLVLPLLYSSISSMTSVMTQIRGG
jgi:hypothetical protein